MFFGVRSRPIRTILRWQLIVTAALTLVVASLLWGMHGAVSAALGGLVNVVGGMGLRMAGHAAHEAVARGGARDDVQGGGGEDPPDRRAALAGARELQGHRGGGFLIAFVITVLVSATAIVVKDA